MRTEFQNLTISAAPRKGAPEPISATSDQFSNTVLNADAAIKSWELRFTDSDHNYHRGFIKITDVEIVDQRKVRITAEIGLRDRSGDWDDTYEGSVDCLIIAMVADN
jgi:hypothetical protein